ncbi:hypothetical protein RvY_10605 [Ramazzottius varieornatus]|uniref:Uncharacterized protein n=1 Tax=Ramazzottius varieornatus TaxID=947166 RepID=A0A1D1VIP7_RAMVA|nr:hypothetical protein RvY_10605 [Ramazzottius varieornatus]
MKRQCISAWLWLLSGDEAREGKDSDLVREARDGCPACRVVNGWIRQSSGWDQTPIRMDPESIRMDRTPI